MKSKVDTKNRAYTKPIVKNLGKIQIVTQSDNKGSIADNPAQPASRGSKA